MTNKNRGRAPDGKTRARCGAAAAGAFSFQSEKHRAAKALSSFLKGENAQSAVEYVMIAAIMAIFGLGAVKLFGEALGSSFKKSAQHRAGPTGITYGI